MNPSANEATILARAATSPLDRALVTAFLVNVPDFVHFKDREGRSIAVSQSKLPTVLADRGKALQILVNLISNAKYAAENGKQPEKTITLRIAAGETGRVRLSVKDNGEGIPSANLERIFNHGFTTKANGHGFGLNCSANAAREMKGSHTVQSDGPGTGATFILDLPASTSV